MKTTRPCTLIRFFVGDHLSHRSHLVRRRDANCTLPNTPRRDPNVFDAVPGTVTADFDIEALAPVIELFFSQISELAFRLTELAPAKELGVCEQRVLIELCMRPTCEKPFGHCSNWPGLTSTSRCARSWRKPTAQHMVISVSHHAARRVNRFQSCAR